MSHAGIVSKRLNLILKLVRISVAPVAPSFQFFLTPAPIPNSKGNPVSGGRKIHGGEKI